MAYEYPLDSNSVTRQIAGGGIQVEFPFPANPLQIIYLDFDGELTRYRNADLSLEIDGVQVEDPKLTEERIAGIVASLDAEFASQNVRFVTERPKDTAYSTIFVGKTSAFDRYGRFAGLAETVDLGNRIRNDNAFVLLDAASADSDIVFTIAHEAGHLLGTLDHGGDGLVRFADDEHEKNPGYIYYYKTNNHTLTGNLDSQVTLEHLESSRTIVSSSYRDDGGDAYVSVGKNYDEAHDVNVLNGGYLQINKQDVSGVDIRSGGSVRVNQDGTIHNVSVASGGQLALYNGTGSNINVQTGGGLFNKNCIISGVTVESGGYFHGSGSNIYVEKGATLGGSYDDRGNYYQITFAQNAGIETFVNLSDKDQTFSYIVKSQGNASAYLWANEDGTNQVLTDLTCCGYLFINSGGVVNGGEVASGGQWNVNQDGTIQNVSVASGGQLALYNGTGSNINIQTSGSLFNKNCIISGVTVESGGYFHGSGSNIYVEEGATLGGSYEDRGNYYQITFAQNAGIETFVNLSDKDQTFSYIVKSQGNASAYLWANEDGTNQVLTDLTCCGHLFINSGGVVNGGEAASEAIWEVNNSGSVKMLKVDAGGRVTVSSGGLLEQSFDVEGNLTINGGGVARIWSASTVTGESASIENKGTIEFLVASAAASGEALLNDYTKINDRYGGYAITVNGDQSSGQYRLIGNAAGFNRSITIRAENSEATGTFQWNNDTGYNTVYLDDRAYTLNIDENNDLVLGVGMNPTRVDYVFAEIGQMFYSNREAPEGSGLDGILMEIPYAADITVTIDKALTEGLYSFTTSVTDVNSSVNCFQIQVSDGESASGDEPASKVISYISDGICQIGSLVGETNSTMTYKFTNVEDYLLLDSLQETMSISTALQPSESSGQPVVSGAGGTTGESMSFIHIDEYPDANKKWCLRGLLIKGTTKDGKSFGMMIEPSKNEKGTYNLVKHDDKDQYVLDVLQVKIDGILYENLKYDLEMKDRGKNFTLTISGEKPASSATDTDSQKQESVIVIKGTIDQYGKVSVTETTLNSESVSTFPRDQRDNTCFTPNDANYCWIATAVNMMYKAGWMDEKVDPTEYYDLLCKYYLAKDGGSYGASVTRVFADFLYKKLDVTATGQRICKYTKNDNTIRMLLNNLASGNGNIVAAIGISNPDHVFTCYKFNWNGKDSGTPLCSDSDSGLFSSYQSIDWEINFTGEKLFGIFWEKNKRWKINYVKQGYKNIGTLVTLLSQNYLTANGLVSEERKLTLDDLANLYKDIASRTEHVYLESNDKGELVEKVYFKAVSYDEVDVHDDGFSVVRGGCFDSVISDGGIVQVASGGKVEEMVVHEGGAVSFETGSIAKGTIRTTGGTLTVESGVDVSEAEFDFAVSRMEGGNNTLLLNSLSNVSGAKHTITIVNSQSAGRYVLAGGASDFAGTLSVIGEYDYTQKIGDGFEDGFIGELGLENTLDIEHKIYSLSVMDDCLVLTIAVDETIFDAPENPVGTVDSVSWNPTGAEQYIVEYSTDNFEHVVRVETYSNSMDSFQLPAGTYQWRVKADGGEEWSVGEEIVSEAAADDTPKVVQAVEDGKDDLFFASTNGKWSLGYYARHVGSINDWTGTNEVVSAAGKGRIRDLFFGSTDPNVLCLTDADNGDAIFVDDAFTGLPEEVEENTARLYRIQEIRAGAGDDIVDMTSQRCEYTGGGLTIRGGDGDDVIWTNKGDNLLFGDAGNDRIVGASGDDFIIGGTGDDSMHGGGGDDVFTFCDNWGADTVEQLEDGFVTLWFASGDESNWNAETLTYTDGTNSVTVSGVSVEQITLLFGDYDNLDHEMFDTLSELGAFDGFTSRKVFEESGDSLLA